MSQLPSLMTWFCKKTRGHESLEVNHVAEGVWVLGLGFSV